MTEEIATHQFDSIMQEHFGTTALNALMPRLEVTYDNGVYIHKGHRFDDCKEALLYSAKESGLLVEIEPEPEFFFCTTPSVEGREAEAVLGLVSADCAYGMNVFRDIFASFRDLVGGRSQAVEKVLKDAKTAVQQEMSEQAKSMGANAIVGVDFDFNELDGGGKNGMLLVSGTGTAVKLKDTD